MSGKGLLRATSSLLVVASMRSATSRTWTSKSSSSFLADEARTGVQPSARTAAKSGRTSGKGRTEGMYRSLYQSLRHRSISLPRAASSDGVKKTGSS